MQQGSLEPLFTINRTAAILGVSKYSVRRLFCGRAGMVNLSTGARPTYRIPLSLLLEVMVERGYSREQADAAVRRALATSTAA